eukprot:1062784-Alexandrium_andersonii.AAC.1
MLRLISPPGFAPAPPRVLSRSVTPHGVVPQVDRRRCPGHAEGDIEVSPEGWANSRSAESDLDVCVGMLDEM